MLFSAEQADIDATIFVVPYLCLVSFSSYLLVGIYHRPQHLQGNAGTVGIEFPTWHRRRPDDNQKC